MKSGRNNNDNNNNNNHHHHHHHIDNIMLVWMCACAALVACCNNDRCRRLRSKPSLWKRAFGDSLSNLVTNPANQTGSVLKPWHVDSKAQTPRSEQMRIHVSCYSMPHWKLHNWKTEGKQNTHNKMQGLRIKYVLLHGNSWCQVPLALT